ncbi:MAG TPA: DNA polymerase Y family protein [Micromonosporaceae bacterium]|jgi:protein ImuB|nr:DNA polymerase Y family protein [Micromonosporaceae bacterium]
MSRTLVLWCPDWPVVAAGLIDGAPTFGPVAVLAANRVIACSAAARREGIRLGLRKRETQARCPEIVVVEHDTDRDARAFEPVVATVEAIAPGVDVVRPGVCALAARGPSRYFGGEERAAEHLVEQVAQACAVEAQVGIADGMFAAGLAARAGRIIPPGGTPAFLADFDIAAIGGGHTSASSGRGPGRTAGTASAGGSTSRDTLVDLLRRLGIRTLGEFAALPAADVLARFGFDAALAHRLAAGLDERPLAARQPPDDLDVTERFDEPIDRVDAAAFAARALAERLHERLAGHGLACTRLGIEAVTERGEELYRTWRHDGLLTAAAIGDRVRWQLDGWLHHQGRQQPMSSAAARLRPPSGGIVRLRLVPDGVVEHAGLQLGLWGDAGAERDRAHRAMARVQGLLGPEAVVTAVRGGGRDPGDEITYAPWGDERVPVRPADQPWPGRLPAPAPATVLVEPLPVDVRDAAGGRVEVTRRLAVTAPPARLVLAAHRSARTPVVATPTTTQASRESIVEIVDWAGPWPVDERWWAPEEASRRTRFQVVLGDGRALLLSVADGDWSVEAIYD